jgi:hypothetical protein
VNIGRLVEVKGFITTFRGIIQSDNGDFTYDLKVTESNSDRIIVGSIVGVMEDSITKFIN